MQYLHFGAALQSFRFRPWLIDQSKDSGYAYFDFGISNEDHGQWLNEGLVQQKSRLGGRGIVYNSYKFKL